MPNITVEEGSSELKAPTSVTESIVKRRLRSDAAQHPFTTLSTGIAAISGIYLLFLSPVFGGNLIATIVIGVSGTLALGNFAYQYRVGRSETLSLLLEDEGNERVRRRDAGLRQRFETLHIDFTALDHIEGTTALDRLGHEYNRLQPLLVDQNQIGIISVPQIEHLTNETYRRGLSVLADSVMLIEAIENPGITEITEEITAIEIEIERLGSTGQRSDRIAIRESVLATQRNRLKDLEQLQVHVDELLYQSHRCEYSLSRTRIELAAIRAGSSDSGVNTVIGALEGTIQRAKEVQKELKTLGY